MKVKTAVFAGLAMAGAALAQPAAAQAYPPVYTLGENDDADLIRCGIRYADAINQANNTLRANRVPMGTEDMAVTQRALALYLNLNISPIVYDDGEDSGSCYGGVTISLQSYSFVDEPVTGTRRFAALTFCQDGFTFTLTRNALRREVERQIEEKVNGCLAEWRASAE
ncbi:hypothetical protein [Erythrobacter sp. EC-HK427]|uniref:hypothetical protein n=1 Tax=Erythrobacter sp. EC-HK427 TaxID=2038396 RepID=UPI001254FEBA|nr:hypothetical protein [Erythrobacter sp. EC-HK427]VVT06614.1 exported hypothetical protein [Erythrobacter sp. EC-HK427]